MGIVEREVGEVVRESNLNEARDIRIAAQVLGVAPAALAPGGLPHATVITAFGADIRGDLFVTNQALRTLPLTVGEVVTVRAFGLDFGVRLGDGTGHDELLDGSRMHRRRGRKRREVFEIRLRLRPPDGSRESKSRQPQSRLLKSRVTIQRSSRTLRA